ncbi:MAG: agmatine deiminase family protein [Spirochaetes bacterium]|nr:agmatine deiminase family protein [Spirochaetota bacterium]MBN2769539.1 agmatine deiminase family protein [Spirochaetota bacterium]
MEIRLPAEWEQQGAVMLAWPHSDSDWAQYLDEAKKCFSRIIKTIAKYQDVIVVQNTNSIDDGLSLIANTPRVYTIKASSNDTWCRDYGFITVLDNGKACLYDFKFNGWGLKFASNYDNMINNHLYGQGLFINAKYVNMLGFVLEGGSIESDGIGTIMTTSDCLLSPNRNGGFSCQEIEDVLRKSFGARRILMLNSGYLSGDDTDSHIDTLARFCSTDTIAYVKCDDKSDPHYHSLKEMEKELQKFTTPKGIPYNLVALPMANAEYYNDERLPATYANFLIINNAILMPGYGTSLDIKAQAVLQKLFPGREVYIIDCSVLIRQHGSLHCVTMQFPENIKLNRRFCNVSKQIQQ